MRIHGLSASAYESYSWCEFKYYLTYALGFKEEFSGPAATLGHMAHKFCEILSRASINKHVKDSKIWNPDYLWEIIDKHYSMHEPISYVKMDQAKVRGVVKALKKLLDSEYSPINNSTMVAEQFFAIPVDDPMFLLGVQDGQPVYLRTNGIIDRIDKLDDETIEIIDYKSGSRTDFESKTRAKKDSDKLMQVIQPRMYHLAAKKLYPWAKNIIVTFIYITDGGPVTIPFCDDDIEDTKKMLYRRFSAIRSNDDPQRNITWKCKKMCYFGQSGVCNKIWAERIESGKELVDNKYYILNKIK